MSSVTNRIDNSLAGVSPSRIVLGTLGSVALACYAAKLFKIIRKKGLKKTVIGAVLSVAKAAPGASALVTAEKEKMGKKIEQMAIGEEDPTDLKFLTVPEKGVPQSELMTMLRKWQEREESKWNKGQVSGGIYHGGKELLSFLVDVYGMFALSNPLHPDVFPYIRKMEAEVVRMTLNMFNGDDDAVGAMTSGGTESIIMACKTYRELGRARGIEAPEIVASATVHAAFDKACEYLGMKLIHVPFNSETFEVDMNAVRKAINSNTILLVGSAPHFPQGIIDPINELSALAVERNLYLHVDCCLGGFLLPWVVKLGLCNKQFDFRLPGVTSISADTHKYGYAPKGTSVIMYRNKNLRHHQYFVAPDWTGGIYASPSMPGSRPGGLIAAAWAAMVSMGENGYLECARAIMDAARVISTGINNIDGLRVLGNPDMSVIAFAMDESSARTKGINIFQIGEAMSTNYHWALNTLQHPSSIHICCTYLHRDAAAHKFVADLEASVAAVVADPLKYSKGSAAIYGATETIGDTTMVTDLAQSFIDALYRTTK